MNPYFLRRGNTKPLTLERTYINGGGPLSAGQKLNYPNNFSVLFDGVILFPAPLQNRVGPNWIQNQPSSQTGMACFSSFQNGGGVKIIYKSFILISATRAPLGAFYSVRGYVTPQQSSTQRGSRIPSRQIILFQKWGCSPINQRRGILEIP